ncbi:MAG: hypothetical protein H6509_14090 [Bryobacterales bacterium]|nr:hypothetical protein [Bryobacterales bacterium]
MFELLFHYPLTVYRKGDFLFASGWPVWLLVLLVLAAGAALFWNMQQSPGRLTNRQKLVIWGLQAAMAATALFAFWQPGLSVQSLSSQQNGLGAARRLALDGAGRRRRTVAPATGRRGPTGRRRRSLEKRFRVRLYTFSSEADRLQSLEELPPPGPSSRIGESVAGVLRESAAIPLGAVIVLSDGSDNSGSFSRELMSEIRKRNVPIHTVGLGATQIDGDLELADVVAPVTALPKSRVSAQMTIRHPGVAQTVRISVKDGDNVLASKEVALRRGENVQVEMVDFSAGEPGLRDLSFTVDPLPGEEITGNNTLSRVMDVPRGRKRVLYVEGEPRWEYKFIRRALYEDPSVQLVTLLRTSTNKYYRQGVDSADDLKEGFPTTREELFSYDGLVIGSFEAAFFTPEQQTMIREFVNQRGGTLLMLAGRNGLADGGWGASQVAEALPAKLETGAAHTFAREKATVRLTVHGRDSLICRLDSDTAKSAKLWDEMPQIGDYQTIGELKPAAVTLLEAEVGRGGIPLLVSQSYGRGKALILATGATWRWKMQLDHEDERHHTFWRQLMRSLTASSPTPVTLTSDRSLYADDPRVRLRAEVRTKSYEIANNAIVNVTVTPEKGEPHTVEMHPSPDEPGVYLGEVIAAAPGTYRMEAKAFVGDESLGSAVTHVLRQDGVAEDFQPAQNRDLLTRLAEQTGGRYWSVDELAGLPEEIRFSEAGISARETLDLWNIPVMFLLLAGLKGTEWLLRRRWGTI